MAEYSSRTAAWLGWLLLAHSCFLALPVQGSRLLRGEPHDVSELEPTELVSTAAVFSGNWADTLVSGYSSNDQLAAWSLDFTQRCSKIARRFSIGKSIKGVDLWVVEIAANPGKVEAKPNFKYVSACWWLLQLQNGGRVCSLRSSTGSLLKQQPGQLRAVVQAHQTAACFWAGSCMQLSCWARLRQGPLNWIFTQAT